jgi:hypothetical protein
MTIPIDLRLIAAERYRITLDESAKADASRELKHWCVQIPAKYGHIGTYSDRELSAYCSGRRLFARLLTIPTVRTVQRTKTPTFAYADQDALGSAKAGCLLLQKLDVCFLVRAEQHRRLARDLDLTDQEFADILAMPHVL